MSNRRIVTQLNSQPASGFILITFISFCSLLASAQQRSGYLSLDAGVYVVSPYNPAIGAHFGGNAELANEVYLGAEIGLVKFNHLNKPYLPLLVRFSALPALSGGRTRALILLAPGYGLYKHDFRRGNDWHESRGGFSFYGGVGVVIPGKKRGSLALSVGYSTFGFSEDEHEYNIDGVGIRIGAMFR